MLVVPASMTLAATSSNEVDIYKRFMNTEKEKKGKKDENITNIVEKITKNIVSKLKRKPGIKIIEIDENQTISKETLMSEDISYEAQKYYIDQQKEV